MSSRTRQDITVWVPALIFLTPGQAEEFSRRKILFCFFSNPARGRGRDRSPRQEFRKVARGRAGAMGVEAPSPEKGLMGATMEVPVSTAEL